MDDRKKLTQECGEWALKVSEVKTMVLKGLGKSPRKYYMEIVDHQECDGEDYWDSEVVIKKRKRYGVPFQVSELSPFDGKFKDHIKPSVVETEGENCLIDINNEARDHNHERHCETSSANMFKEQVLELESPSYI